MFLTCLSAIALLSWLGVKVIQVAAVAYGAWRLHKKKQFEESLGDKPIPGVSILKPLCSTDSDPYLLSNLETFFTMDYPLYELLFCIQDSDEQQLLKSVDHLMKKHPRVSSQVFCGGSNLGVNPKVNNISPGYSAAKYDLILISDSRIKMKKDTLTDMVSCMSDNVGLVHQMPFTCDRAGIPAAILEKIYFGTSLARIYIVSHILGINSVTGMSVLIRKHILEKAGGLKHFAAYLAEDFFFARAVQEAGFAISISSQPAGQNAGNGGIVVFQNRIIRWTKLRAAMVPHTILLEPLSECMVLGAASSWAVLYLLKWDPLSFFFIHVLLWFLMDWMLLRIVQNGALPFNKFEFLVMWLFRELTSPYVFLVAQMYPKIQWRSKYFKVRWGGIAEPCGEDKQSVPSIV